MHFDRRTPLACLLVGASLALACHNTGHRQVDATSVRMSGLRESVEDLKTRVALAAGALESLVDKAEVDPAARYQQFEKETSGVETAYRDTQARLTNVQADAETLFNDWSMRSNQIADEGLRRKSQERRLELTRELDSVVDALRPTLDDVKSFVGTSKDLLTYLSQDLTVQGIRTIDDEAESHSERAKSLGEQLDRAIAATRNAEARFAVAKPPAAEPAPAPEKP